MLCVVVFFWCVVLFRAISFTHLRIKSIINKKCPFDFDTLLSQVLCLWLRRNIADENYGIQGNKHVMSIQLIRYNLIDIDVSRVCVFVKC